MLIINQCKTDFFCVKFYEKSEHIAKSNLYCTYLSTYTHIYIDRPTTKLILSLGSLFAFLSKNSCLRRFITFQVCNVGYFKRRHSMSKSFCWLLRYLSYVYFKQRLLIYSYKIDIYSKTAFYSQPIKNVLLIVLKNLYLWEVIFIYLSIIIYLFKFYTFVLYCKIILQEYLFLTFYSACVV